MCLIALSRASLLSHNGASLTVSLRTGLHLSPLDKWIMCWQEGSLLAAHTLHQKSTACLGFWPFLVLQCYRAGREHSKGLFSFSLGRPRSGLYNFSICLNSVPWPRIHARFHQSLTSLILGAQRCGCARCVAWSVSFHSVPTAHTCDVCGPSNSQ